MVDSLEQLFSEIETDKLPSLPHVLLLLLDASHNEVISFDELSSAIQKDAGLTARIVGTASSAYYAGQGKELTFERVLVLLGLDTIKTIAITASVHQFFSRFDSVSAVLLKRLWRSSLICAVVTRELAKLTGYPYQDEAYIVGLLHNVGQLIFNTNFPDYYPALTELAKSKNDLVAAELETFGAHHCDAGAWLIDKWGINPFMADAVRFQSEPMELARDAHQLVKILYVASRICELDEQDLELGFQAGESLFDLNRSLMTDMVEKAIEQVQQAAQSMDIDFDNIDRYSEADEEKQIALGDRIRSVALLEGMRRELADSKSRDQVLEAVRVSMNILFSAPDVYFFQKRGEQLQGYSLLDKEHPVNQLTVDLETSTSLLAQSIKQSRTLDSVTREAGGTVSILDRQIINLLQQQAIICLPLLSEGEPLGVMVIGSAQLNPVTMAAKTRLLAMFAGEVARALAAVSRREQQDQDKAETDRDYFHARAREIVHEANNPLSIINNYVHILSDRLGDNHEAQEELSVIKEELARTGNILLRLPGITEKPMSEGGQELVDINQLLTDLLKLFRSSLFVAHKIESVTDLDQTAVPVVVDRNALKQVLTNLVKNAAESMSSGGVIRVATTSMVNHNGRQYMAITIEDNGPGIPVEVQENLFQPVQTTKGEAHAGLGLTIVKSLLDAMDALISCRSDSRSGTRFEILVSRNSGS